jgi:hypothetical protein
VKKSIVVLLAALTVAAAGCQKQEEIGKAPAPSAAVKSGAPQPTARRQSNQRPLNRRRPRKPRPRTHPSAPPLRAAIPMPA